MIIDRQRRLAEIGRIRMGDRKQGNRPGRPRETWRLTSRVKERLESAARVYGGEVRPWEGQWELLTETNALHVMVAPGEAVSQFYELWSAGGCQRRCDGATESISDQPCLCDPEKRECNTHTRFSVILPHVPGLGLWRLESHGYYASVELAPTAEFVQGLGSNLMCVLRIDHREVKRDGQTKKFAVPILDADVAPLALMGGQAPTGYLPPAPVAGELERPGYQPLPAGDGTTVAGALESVQGDPPPRRRAARPQAELGPAAPPPAAAPIPVPDDPDDRGEQPAAAAPAAKSITEAQVKRLWTIARGKTMPEDEVKRLVLEVTGQDSTRAIPKGELYDAVIAAIEAWDPLDILPKPIDQPATASGDDEQTGFESIPFGDPAPTPEA